MLYLASGRGRSAIYAVYRYFEYYCGCSYFWDGDTLPPRTDIVWENVALSETPRFDYRGTRYFAHRSLHRFQAEMWGPEDWEREIDWLLKKRMNLFMLRLGLDDVFQKAFPTASPTRPRWRDSPRRGRGSTTARSSWPLEYRGVLAQAAAGLRVRARSDASRGLRHDDALVFPHAAGFPARQNP